MARRFADLLKSAAESTGAIKRETVTDQVTSLLRERILSGELAEGDPIRQEAIGAELGVSRIPVREAIRQLEAEGLVATETHKGAIVRALSRLEIRELFEMRVQLECWLFSLALPALGQADFERAEAIIEETDRRGTIDTWSTYNWLFHQTLYLPAHRHNALKILKTIHDNGDRYIRLYITITPGRETTGEEHRDLLAIARSGDTVRARDALERHIMTTADRLEAGMEARARTSQQGGTE